jgi:ERCC4-type nuclease
MPIKYILDTREKALQSFFIKNSISFETKQLDLGDILILYSKGEIVNPEEANSNENKLLKKEIKIQEHPVHTFVIERKSFTDLKASMSDNRYHEQKSRYMKLPKGSMFYIFENNDPSFKELGKKQYLGAYVHTMIRDDIKVFYTQNMEETYEMILKIGDTLEKFGFNELLTQTSTNIETTQIKKKKANGSEVYKQQLCCIPGISSGKADLIVAEYSNLGVLMQAIKDNKFKVKGIGKVLLDKIKETLFFNSKNEECLQDENNDDECKNQTPKIIFE